MQKNRFYLAPTYLKMVLNEPELATIVMATLGDELEQIVQKEFVSSDYIEPIFKAFEQAGLDSWVLRFGSKLSSTTHAALGFAALSAPTLRDSLQVFADYACVRTSAYDVRLEESEQRLMVVCNDNTDSELLGRWLLETAMYVEKRLIENIMTHPVGEQAEIHFQHAAPVYAPALEKFLQIKCRYECKKNAFIIPASWGYVPSPLYDPGTYQTNLAKCREIKHRLQANNSVLESVKAELESFFQRVLEDLARPSDLPSQITLARKLALSPRTFARKLKQQKSSYKHELELARRNMASELLENTHLRVADIAYYLAYQETANFIRAFKIWFGCTPSQWRRTASTTKLNRRKTQLEL